MDVETIFEQYILQDEYYTKGHQPIPPKERLRTMKAKYSKEQYDEIEDIVYAALSLGERQGFINGYTYHNS